MNYADEDLRRASRLVVVQPGADVAHQVRALCLAFSEVRNQALEAAALAAETCPISTDGGQLVPHFINRDAEIAKRIRNLK